MSYLLPSAAAALLYSCLFSYLGSAADDLLTLLNGGASAANLGTTWLAAGTGLAVISAFGLVKVCRQLLSPQGAGDGLSQGVAGGPPAGAARRQYAPLRQREGLEEGAAAAAAAATAAAAAAHIPSPSICIGPGGRPGGGRLQVVSGSARHLDGTSSSSSSRGAANAGGLAPRLPGTAVAVSQPSHRRISIASSGA